MSELYEYSIDNDLKFKDRTELIEAVVGCLEEPDFPDFHPYIFCKLVMEGVSIAASDCELLKEMEFEFPYDSLLQKDGEGIDVGNVTSIMDFLWDLYNRLIEVCGERKLSLKFRGNVNYQAIADILNEKVVDQYYWVPAYEGVKLLSDPEEIQLVKDGLKIKGYLKNLEIKERLAKDGLFLSEVKEKLTGDGLILSEDWVINVRFKYEIEISITEDSNKKGILWKSTGGHTGVLTSDMLKDKENFIATIHTIVNKLEIEEVMLECDFSKPFHIMGINSEERRALFEKIRDLLSISDTHMYSILHEIKVDRLHTKLRADNDFVMEFGQKVKIGDDKIVMFEAYIDKFDLKANGNHISIYRGEINDGGNRIVNYGRFIYDVRLSDGKEVSDEYRSRILDDLYAMTTRGEVIRFN